MLLWAALQGSFSIGNLLFGFLLGVAVVAFARPLYDPDDPSEKASFSGGVNPVRRVWRFLVLVVVFLWELVVSGLQVARYILQPTLRVQSGIVEYPLDVTTDREITALSNLITLTPGTMTLDVSPDRTHIYVHAMSVETDDGREVIDEIKGSLEKHVHRALGPRD
jgi:multicomponent Na+:H+ antiporter subunit E